MLNAFELDLPNVVTWVHSRALTAKAAERMIAAIAQEPLAPDLDECIKIAEFTRENGAWISLQHGDAADQGKNRLGRGRNVQLGSNCTLSKKYGIYAGNPTCFSGKGSRSWIPEFNSWTCRASFLTKPRGQGRRHGDHDVASCLWRSFGRGDFI